MNTDAVVDEEIELLGLRMRLPHDGGQTAHVIPHKTVERGCRDIDSTRKRDETSLQLSIVRLWLPIHREQVKVLAHSKNVNVQNRYFALRAQVANNPRSRLETDTRQLVQPVPKSNVIFGRSKAGQLFKAAAQISCLLPDEPVFAFATLKDERLCGATIWMRDARQSS